MRSLPCKFFAAGLAAGAIDPYFRAMARKPAKTNAAVTGAAVTGSDADKPAVAPARDDDSISVQVFVEEHVAPERIEPMLRDWIASNDARSGGLAKFGRLSRLAKSVALEAPRHVIDLVRGAPQVVEVLSNHQSDVYPKPVAIRPVEPSDR